MNRMTENEKEALLVGLFNSKKEKEDRIKEIDKNIKELEVLQSRVASEIKGMSPEKREAYLSMFGRGKYADAILEPARLKQEYNNLKNSATEKYHGEVSRDAIKAFEGKGPVLQEDIEIAENEAQKAEKQVSDIFNADLDLNSRKKGIKKDIKTQIRELKQLQKDLKLIERQIKKTDKIKTEETGLGRGR